MFEISRWLNYIADSKKLFAGVLLFIVLDLSILTINYWIAHQVDKDAVAINLAGRERMLSQRITKSLLALQLNKSPEDQTSSILELRHSVSVFDQTLSAFEHGGTTTGGSGNSVVLDRVSSGLATELVRRATDIWEPTRELLFPYLADQTTIPDEVLLQAQRQMLRDNLALLDLMNRLTSSLEQRSRDQVNSLRITQTIVFFLALVNFLAIVNRFHLLARKAHQSGQHFSELALRDPLTGLYNRRHFDDCLEREISATDRRPQSRFALMMIDLDGFKPINDKLGHAAGDIVLKAVATRLLDHARTNDTVARLGGDEFMLICTDLHADEDAAMFCERLLAAINEPIELGGEQVLVGASIGVAFYPDQTKSVFELMHMADHAMYAAKKAGRNRYAFSSAS